MQKALTLTETGIGKKVLVAVTGAMLFGWLIIHLIGNLQIFLGADHINEYSEFLQSLPKLVWATRITLLVVVLIHMYLTIELAMRNRAARTARYAVVRDAGDQSPLMRYARKTMVLSGPIIGFFIAFHIAHLTVGADVVPGYEFQHLHPYENMVYGFRNPLVAAFYMTATLLIGLHIFHGGQSLFQSLGLRHPQWDPRSRGAAAALAIFITIGNLSIPLSVLSRLVGGELP